MKKQFLQFNLCALILLLLQPAVYAQISTKFKGRFSIGTYNSNGGVAEITAFDPASKRMFVINGPDTSIRIVNIADPASPILISSISVKPYGIDVTSIACNKNGLIALAIIDSNGKTNPSSIVFMDINGTFISKVKAGANADHVIFTGDGKKLLVANEGEPNVGYTIDPEGSVSIIDLTNGAATLTQANVTTAGFTAFNAPAIIDPKIRIFGRIQTSGGAFLRNSTVAEDLEPEYIAISDDNTTAWVTCQENNCLAVVNINTGTITSLLPLGAKNHRIPGYGLDPSDRDNGSNAAIAKIDTFPVFGLYLPDGIASYKSNNQNYLVTANEGDARADWGAANVEENRVGDAAYVLDTTKFGGAAGVAAIKANIGLGRLNVTNRYGDFNNDGKFDSIYTFGARSFSIWDGSNGSLIWDSKDEFEQRLKTLYPTNFNCSHTNNSLDDRSDNKGPEPESVTIGKIKDSTYAFVALERIGGIMIYNITIPSAPYFVQYINTRDFSVTPSQANLATVGDLGPEGIVFIPSSESPTGEYMIMLSNEVSGTVALFTISTPETQGITKIQDYKNTNSPAIGTFQGINYKEAGFSSLFPIPNTNGKEFWTCSDRGVNIDCANANPVACRPTYDKLYAFPSYSPKIHRIRINGDSIQILQSITIKRPKGTGASGIINPTGLGSTATEVATTDTVLNCANFSLKTTPKDTFGIDPEGLVVDKSGNFWLCEEGGATIWQLNPNGVLIKRYTPYANLAGVQSVDVQIDTVFKYRKNNRGFEGIAIAPNGKIYAIIQSGIQYPSVSTGDNTRVHRIIEIDPATGSQRMITYLNDGIIGSNGANQIRMRDWKIGDMAAVNDSIFLVLEAAARGTQDIKRLYQININQATTVHSGLYGGLTLEGLVDSTGLANKGIKAVSKTLVMDLLASGWPSVLDKAEGLAIINDSTIAIVNDNDFGQTSALADGIATATGNLSHLITYRISGSKKLVNYNPSNLSVSTQSSYLIPAAPGVKFNAILTAGDEINGYKMAGIPDGTGAFDNNDGTFTLLVNHEIPNTSGAVRAHGAKGAFVSKWVINKSDLSVVSGSDLISKVNLWTGSSYTLYNPADTASKKAFGRFCSADLPAVSAFYNATSGLGTQERIFLNGEESGNEGRAFGHIATGTNAGTTYELPHLGKFSWENAIANPMAQDKTIVAGTDDSTPGQVYMYVGTKTNAGSEVDKAGLTNGRLYGIAVAGLTTEVSASFIAPNTAFTMVDLGIVRDSSGAALNSRSNALSVTNFLRPEDGAWDPANPNDFYFVTTNSFTAPSRMYRLRFTNINNPTAGGTITAVLDGTEGPKMMDNIGADNFGHIIIQEDVGSNVHLGKMWQYTIASDKLELIATHDSTLFISGAPNFLTQDEEASGIIDVQQILGPGHFLLVDQAHYAKGTEIYEGGQILAMFKPTGNFTLQVLHSSDMESSTDAVIDAPNFAAVMDKLENTYPNTVKLASGDCFIPSPFLSAGEDASIQTPLRNTASHYYSGSTAGLRAAIGRVDIAMMNIMGFQGSALGNHEFDLGTSEVNSIIGVDIRSNGADKRWVGAQFPYLSANLDFNADVNLSYLYTNKRLAVDSFKTSPTITANSQKKGLAPSSIIYINGEKIGLVGATTQLLASISSPGSTSVIGPKTDDMPALAAILQPVIDSLRFAEGINKIIVMSHLQQLANEKALAPLLKGVDIIIAGGSHALCADGNDRIRAGNIVADKYPILTQNKDNEPLAILNTTSEWKYVGRFVVNFTENGILIPSLLDSMINGAYAADTAMVTQLWGTYANAFNTGSKAAAVRTLTTAIANVINTKDGNKFGKSSVFLEGRRDFVRTQETNLGNVSSDANLWMAKKYDAQVKVSIKNGGGIRSAIGQVVSVGNGVQLLPTAANPGAGKNAGDISQLDIENSLRFNNKLSILSVNAAGLKRILEHGVSATKPGITPGQFPQIGGVMFSYDTTKAAGSKIQSMVLIDSTGKRLDTIVRFGLLHGDTSRIIKVVTLDFLASGGDNYPFVANGFNRINLDTAIKDSMVAKFQANGSEQDAFAEYFVAKHQTNPYAMRDTGLIGDTRIQLLNARPDGIFAPVPPVITIAAARGLATDSVRVRGIVTRAWGRFIYIQDATGAIGVRQSSGAMVDSILSSGIKEGDSVEVWGGRGDFNNYAQIQLLTGAYRGNSNVIKLANNRPLPPAILLTLKQLNTNGEQYESKLVRVVNLKTSGTGNITSSTNYTVWDGATPGDTMIWRVISSQDTEMDDAPATPVPSGNFIFEGTLIQFCSSPTSGCTLGYQLQGVRKKDIIPVLGTLNLQTPVTNTRIVTSPSNVNLQSFVWTKSGNAVMYKWFLTPTSGNFTSPWMYMSSASGGTDTTFQYANNLFDTLLAQKGISKGDSISVKWTVYAYLGNDSIMASQSNNLLLVREKIVIPTAPEINVQGNSITILDGDITPSSTDNTEMGSVVTGGNINKVFVIQNTGNDLLTLTSITFTGTNASDFSLVSAPVFPLSIAQGTSANITVKFAPTVAGIKTSTINIANNDGNESNYDFALSGTSTAPLVSEINIQGNNVTINDGDNTPTATDNTDFGDVLVGNSKSSSYVIQNNGTGDLTITGISFTGANASDYSLSTAITFPAVVNASGVLNFTVKFQPSVAGPRNATIQIANSDADESIYNFDLKGNGTSTSLSEKTLLKLVTLYPNPVSGDAILGFELANTEKLQIAITDIQGRTVAPMESKIFQQGKHETIIPTADLQSGVYFVKIANEENKNYLIKMVVIH